MTLDELSALPERAMFFSERELTKAKFLGHIPASVFRNIQEEADEVLAHLFRMIDERPETAIEEIFLRLPRHGFLFWVIRRYMMTQNQEMKQKFYTSKSVAEWIRNNESELKCLILLQPPRDATWDATSTA
jgi:hypothetical protein